MTFCPECRADLNSATHYDNCSQAAEMFRDPWRKRANIGLGPVDLQFMDDVRLEAQCGRGPLADDGSANPKKAMGATKLRMDLLPPAALIEMAKALQYGALYAMKKDGTRGYGEWDWRDTKIDYKTYLRALRSHIDSIIDREDLDPDSRAHHLGHVMAGCGIVLDAQACGTLVDNRPKKSAPIAKLRSSAVEWVKSWNTPKS